MSKPEGRFVWYELMTTDTEAAKAFYSKVVGWTMQDTEMPGMVYTLLLAGQAQVGGLMTLPEEACKMGAPPHWMGYVGVNDVDATVERAKGLGASVYVQPMDIPNIGRFAVLADPQGASIAVFSSPTTPPDPPANPCTPGYIGWHELAAADREAAFAFYSALFGWKKSEAHDMGEMGIYQLFSTDGGQAVGGMFTKPPMIPRPFWLYYFGVDNIDAAAERVKAAGGQIINGPMEVPGGAWIVQGKDPQGAMFALLGMRS